MTKVSPIDYKRVSSLPWQTINVEVPEELVVAKGSSSLARKRCRDAEARLKCAVRDELQAAGRRRFRGDVAVHLELSGVSISQPDRARRTVKAILDSLQGPLYVDDREVALLDVRFRPGPLRARISACGQGRYTDAFDILGGVSRGRRDRPDYDNHDDDLFGLIHGHGTGAPPPTTTSSKWRKNTWPTGGRGSSQATTVRFGSG